MIWIVVDELPMRIAMYSFAWRALALSLIVALFTAALLYLALRWLVIRPLQDLSADMMAFNDSIVLSKATPIICPPIGEAPIVPETCVPWPLTSATIALLSLLAAAGPGT